MDTICKHCGADINNYDASDGAWVDSLSGDDGGTYDHCPESPNGAHRPGR